LADELGKLKPVIENPGDNPLRRLKLELGCKTTATEAYFGGVN
jgi:hypothetical protein